MIEHYALDLPGKSLYKVPFNLKVRKITPIEVKYLESLFKKQQFSIGEYIDFVKKLIEIDNEEMKFEDLFWLDLQYILYQIRYRTFPNFPIRLYFVCTGVNEDGTYCKKEFSQPLDIGTLPILEPSDIEGFSTELVLDNLGKVHIHNKRVRDDIDMIEFAKQHEMDINDPETLLFLTELFSVDEYGYEDMYKFAEDGTLTAEDMLKIEDKIMTNVWGIREQITIKCPVCGKEESRPYMLRLGDYFSVYRPR